MALTSGDILYDREPDGRIVEIVRRYSRAAVVIRLLFVAAFFAGGAILVMIANTETTHRLFRSIHYMGLGIASIGMGLWLLGRELYLFIQGKTRFFTIADASGLHFRLYSSLGTIPWTAVEGFELVPSTIQTLGDTLLVARLNNPDEFRRRINPNGVLSSKLPFATLECSDEFLNLGPVRNALIEMKSQMAAG